MAGFHLPGDPYFPDQGQDVEPKENHEIPLKDDFAENFPEDSDSELEAYNLPPVAQNPNPRPAFQDPMPLWVESLETRSQEQGQPMPYNGDRSFYNLSVGGSADRVLPILARRVARNEIQGRTTINQIMEIDANAGVNTVRIRRLEDARDRAMRDNEALLQELAVTRAEVIEF
ncbi:hypothetical protein Lser_V15G33885 [Lactuca serriola]